MKSRQKEKKSVSNIEYENSRYRWRNDGTGHAAVGGVEVKFDPAMVERIRREGFDGLEFKIRSILPITNLPLLLGLRKEEERLAQI
jgi:hypothetical protein